MTPSQHKTAAAANLADYEAMTGGVAGGKVIDAADVLLIQVQAQLGRAAGTGTHYTAADSIVATITSGSGMGDGGVTKLRQATAALAHAILAD